MPEINVIERFKYGNYEVYLRYRFDGCVKSVRDVLERTRNYLPTGADTPMILI
ncbi:MAG: hypothetical protein LBB48_08695 [Treponema sp.]|jgi:hypothetical protein|nr:hypothetical protein [Treponema sp.]